MSNEILKDRLGAWKGKDAPAREAIEDLERVVVSSRERLQALGDGAPGTPQGPFTIPRGQTVQAGSVVFVVRGSVHPASYRGEWMGEFALGVVDSVASGQALVIFTGKARARVTRSSQGARLTGGERLFVSSSPGALATGWPSEGEHVYPVGHVVGDHRGYLVDVWVSPQTGMRFG